MPPYLKPFKAGAEWTGNRFGRPKGSKSKLSESFISALSNDFDEHGISVIETVRMEKPADYLKIIASIVPKELTVNGVNLDDMSDEELIDRLSDLKDIAAALTAGNRSPAGQGARKPPKTH